MFQEILRLIAELRLQPPNHSMFIPPARKQRNEARSPVIVPIPGTSSLAHLDENVAAARIPLSTEDLHELS